MNGPVGPPAAVLGLGLDLSGAWPHRASPPGGAGEGGAGGGGGGGGRGSRSPVRLPSLVAAGRGRSSLARLSISEPSLFNQHDQFPFDGFSSNHRPSVLRRQPPPPPPAVSKSSSLLPCRSCRPPRTTDAQQQVTPVFLHFSQSIQPCSRPRAARRHSHNLVLTSERPQAQGDLRPPAAMLLQPGEPLSVVGKPYLPSCSKRLGAAASTASSTSSGPARTQLHVFLPTESEGEDGDRESVDEGFMDELDSKITSLKLQQGAPKTATQHK